jgi:DNA-binding winged helix-turn-helix (wHTH) protein/TolB-like protein/Tfp pilus assembly protein PilF
METGRVFAFGNYRLEVPLRRLLRGDQPIPLTPKAFDVLLALVERRDRVVGKAELMQLVWPGSFVEEANLSQTVFVLRKTLGQTPDGHPYIETVPRHGYRFAADVQEEQGSATVVRASPVARRSSWRVWVPAAAAVGILAGTAVWRTWPHSAAVRPVARARVVVLPFENLTDVRADDWLAGAFSDSLTSGLQEVGTLIPVSRDRVVELYRREGIGEASAIGADALRRVTDALRVQYVVHGSYQKLGERIKVSARLIEAKTGAIEAQETLTEAFTDLFSIEDDLAARFALKLRAPTPPARARAEPASLEAYRAFVEGRTLYAQTRHQEAIGPLTRATALDDGYARAWALLAKNQARLGTITAISSGAVGDIRRAALEYAQRAVKLAPDSYEAHLALALANRELEDVQQWRGEALHAIELAPQIAEGYELVADSYFAANAWGCRRDRNPELAERYFDDAIRLDPLWAAPYANLSYHYSWLGREQDALRTAEQGLAVLPNNPTIARARALALVRLGRANDAERTIRQTLAGGSAVSGQDHLILASVSLARGNAAAAVREFEMASARLPTTTTFLAIARAYLDAGELETGLSHLDRAVALDSSCAHFAATTPAFARHRDAPEFRAHGIMRK